MYNQYWGLNAKPFDPAHDDRFYFASEYHQAALLKLRYSIENRRGGALLSGGPGLGKTLVIRRLLHVLDETFQPRLHVVFPKMDARQLMSFLANHVGGQRTSPDRLDESISVLQQSLAQNTSEGRHAIIAIDEAHLLQTQDSFDSLRLLLNFQSAGNPDLSLIFVGQPALLTAIHRVPGLEDRISIKCMLRALSIDEAISYVQHRLAAAGCDRAIFDSSALQRIYALTLGVPSQINRLCDLALVVGFAEELSSIDAQHIDAVAAEVIGLTEPIAA